ncbi:MAG TPA: hypothetical protein EYN38_04570, partial [Flavobacteriales bacterium]|nr:hypothetical protein [Flavobacteriales bacterium]HIO72362.1 hypothetical protein [Flavobacteriales bacterium]
MKATNDSLKIYALIAFFLLALIPQISAQTSYAGQTAYGGSKDDYAESISPTLDGGFIISGYSLSYTSSYSPFLTKLDSLGAVEWSKVYGTGYGFAYDAQQTSDGGYIAAGYLDEFSGFNRDY